MVVQCRLAPYWYQNHHSSLSLIADDIYYKEWRRATIKIVDKHSGQCQLCVRVGGRDYLWWCHLDNIDELKPCNYNDDSFEFGIDQHNESNNTYFPFTNSSPSFRE